MPAIWKGQAEMDILYNFLSWIMNGCYDFCHNYGWSIVLFTFISKIVLLPVSLWTYMNSITMIKIQPDINFLKITAIRLDHRLCRWFG